MSIEIPESLAEIRRLIKGAVDGLVRNEVDGVFVTEVWMGPRSSQIGFRMSDGREVSISVQVKEAVV